jgi:hypothetical protein
LRPALLLLPLLLGSDCPGGQSREMLVVIEAFPSQVTGEIQPPAQQVTSRVRFRSETASHDVELQAGLLLEGSVLAAGAPIPRPDATVLFTHAESGTSFTAQARDGGLWSRESALPGLYDVTIYPDQNKFEYGLGRLQVTVPDDALTDLPVPWGEHEIRGLIVRREIGVADPVGLPDLVVEAFVELQPGVFQRSGQFAVTARQTASTEDGEFLLGLPAGVYALRISSSLVAEEPYPSALITGFEVPRPHPPPSKELEVVFAYPTWNDDQRNELGGKLLTTGLQPDIPEGNAEVVAWGVVEAPAEYQDLDGIDFHLGPLRARAFSSSEGYFNLQLPVATYSLSVVPGYSSDASAFLDTGGDVVEGVRIEVRNLELSGFSYSVTTDATGTARFVLEQGHHEVSVIPPSDSTLARSTFGVEMGAVGQRRIVTLQRGIHVTGQVAVGNDILDGVWVRLRDPADGSILGEGLSRPSGTYELRIPHEWVWPETDADDSAE